jgi:hypothetical protein
MSQLTAEDEKDAAIWAEANGVAMQSEADVEGRLVRPLLEALGYSTKDIRAKPPIVFREGRKGRRPEADFLVYDGPLQNRDSSLMVVEAKSPAESLRGGKAQAESYAANARAPFLLLTNGVDLEIWQMQHSKESELALSCKIADLLANRGRIESLISHAAAVTHCRSLHLKALPQPSGLYVDYERAELARVGGRHSISRTLRDQDGQAIRSDALASQPGQGAVVFAASGFGKSMMVVALHKASLGARVQAGKGLLSVEVQLPDLAAAGQTLRAYLLDRISAHSVAVSEAALADQLRGDGVIVIGDRLDRIPLAARKPIEADLRNFLRDFPSCQLILFDRIASGSALGLKDYELLPLTNDEQRALAEMMLGRSGPSILIGVPAAIESLASHPLLLSLLLDHHARKGSFPHQLAQLFETWLDAILDRNGKAPSAYARLRRALAIIADRTAAAPIRVEDALAALAAEQLSDSEFDELVSSHALQSDRTVEVQHEALADYLRAERLLSGDELASMARIKGAPITGGSLLPAFLVEGARTPALQSASWARIMNVGLASYSEALRYRADLSAHYRLEDAKAVARLVVQDVLDGITDPLNAFFPQLIDKVTQATTGQVGTDLAIVGNVFGTNLTYGLRPQSAGDDRITIGLPLQGEDFAGLNLNASHRRFDSGRLIGFRRLRKEINNLVDRRWLHGGPQFANERLISRLRVLAEEHDLVLDDIVTFDDIERTLGPHRGRYAAHPLSKSAFWIDELFEDIIVLRAAGHSEPDLWWTQFPPLSIDDADGAQALIDAHWKRAQLIYAEIATHSFAAIKDELVFFTALPVRYAVSLYPREHVRISSHSTWLPVASWEQAGADVEIVSAPPSLQRQENFAEASVAFARLERRGLASLSMSTQPAPTFDGNNLLTFDGQTGTLRAAMEMTRGDLDRIMGRALFQEPDL